MTFKKRIKRWFYNSCPGFAGSFPYLGTKVYFPAGTPSLDQAISEGLYEGTNVDVLRAFARSESVYFDIGSHLGLMAIPILNAVADIRVVSFEPSPNSRSFLERTASESRFRGRWEVVKKAVSNNEGTATFTRCPEDRAFYDGLRSTGRAPTFEQVDVDVTTVDIEWRKRGEPSV